ncbi:MAG: hypothetical protein KDC54_00355 [Lewinella sp.]|nr:hypothetical protein [Lewinella sp.]
MKTKWIIYGVIILVFIAFRFIGGGNEEAEAVDTEEVVTPTQGLITTVKEVETDKFLIEDEQVVDDPEASLIIARYMDSSTDTFTLDQAQLVADSSSYHYSPRGSSVVRMASFGLMGYMMGRNMGAYRPSSSAYVDPNTYNRVTNNAGQSMQRTANRTTISRPRSGSSGFGGSRSTRSFGG